MNQRGGRSGGSRRIFQACRRDENWSRAMPKNGSHDSVARLLPGVWAVSPGGDCATDLLPLFFHGQTQVPEFGSFGAIVRLLEKRTAEAIESRW